MLLLSQIENALGLYESLLMAWVFAFVALAFYLLGRYFTSRPPREDARLRQISDESPYNGEPEAGIFGDWAPALAAQIPESATEQKEFRQMLRQAGIYQPRASETIYALRFILLVAPVAGRGHPGGALGPPVHRGDPGDGRGRGGDPGGRAAIVRLLSPPPADAEDPRRAWPT